MATVIESFEDGSIDGFSGDTDRFDVGSRAAYDGEFAVSSIDSGEAAISRTDLSLGPDDTPFGCALRSGAYVGDLFSSPQDAGFVFGVQTATGYTALTGYLIRLQAYTDEATLYRFDDGSTTELDTVEVGSGVNEWHLATVTDWSSSGDITVEIADATGTVVGTLSASDATYGAGGVAITRDGGTYSEEASYADYIFTVESVAGSAVGAETATAIPAGARTRQSTASAVGAGATDSTGSRHQTGAAIATADTASQPSGARTRQSTATAVGAGATDSTGSRHRVGMATSIVTGKTLAAAVRHQTGIGTAISLSPAIAIGIPTRSGDADGVSRGGTSGDGARYRAASGSVISPALATSAGERSRSGGGLGLTTAVATGTGLLGDRSRGTAAAVSAVATTSDGLVDQSASLAKQIARSLSWIRQSTASLVWDRHRTVTAEWHQDIALDVAWSQDPSRVVDWDRAETRDLQL